MEDTIKKLGWRFLRGFITGTIGVLVAITPFAGGSLNELGDWLFALSIAIIGGGVSGGLLAIGKYLREKGIYNLPF